MKAFVRTSSKDQNIELAEVPVPAIDADEALVKVHAFGVGIHDGYFIPGDAAFPYVIGTEAAGVVVNTGGAVTQFKVGDRVMLTSSLQAKGGCWADYVAVPESSLIALPDALDFVSGAAIPIAGKTALESMRALDLQSGDSLFVAGASGAIGTLVIQLATAAGVRVAGSASARNHEHMQAMGAQKTVDYRAPDWVQQVLDWMPGGVSAALAIQPGTADGCIDVVADGGRVVTVSGDPVDSRRNVRVFQFEHHADTQPMLARLAADIAAGKVRLVIERIYGFESALEALAKSGTRHARGKSVVRVEHA